MARAQLQQKEEKDRHKEILRRMREGYDGRRGGIAGGGNGARGMHRFDQLVAADNRDDAKRLGLLNDDELDSEDDKNMNHPKTDDADEEEDETALLDKMLKDRFLHRSKVDLEENFSEDEQIDANEISKETLAGSDDEEQRSQERLAKRFNKRARMQRIEEAYGHSQEFSQQRLLDQDISMQEELSQMRCGLIRRSSSLSRHSSQSSDTKGSSDILSRKRDSCFEHSNSVKDGDRSAFQKGSLSIALRASKKQKRKSSFLGGSNSVDGAEICCVCKTVQLGHIIFDSRTNKSQSGLVSFSNTSKCTKYEKQHQSSLFSKISAKNDEKI